MEEILIKIIDAFTFNWNRKKDVYVTQVPWIFETFKMVFFCFIGTFLSTLGSKFVVISNTLIYSIIFTNIVYSYLPQLSRIDSASPDFTAGVFSIILLGLITVVISFFLAFLNSKVEDIFLTPILTILLCYRFLPQIKPDDKYGSFYIILNITVTCIIYAVSAIVILDFLYVVIFSLSGISFLAHFLHYVFSSEKSLKDFLGGTTVQVLLICFFIISFFLQIFHRLYISYRQRLNSRLNLLKKLSPKTAES